LFVELIVIAACAASLYFPSLAVRLEGEPFQSFVRVFASEKFCMLTAAMQEVTHRIDPGKPFAAIAPRPFR
jgi:hypothetical protein